MAHIWRSETGTKLVPLRTGHQSSCLVKVEGLLQEPANFTIVILDGSRFYLEDSLCRISFENSFQKRLLVNHLSR